MEPLRQQKRGNEILYGHKMHSQCGFSGCAEQTEGTYFLSGGSRFLYVDIFLKTDTLFDHIKHLLHVKI